ncbi:maleylpyruvate isomerase family mycothiol-dependent enzyme [Gordonia hongkongensis]|jgi:uncharacterized protein (TIGR03083 family)|nr:maleylpyruvate isomerase family mycothiol-dependent enzyme [Gordonia hongkongensis]UPG68518.1 maleylpyruvate isomerase family mycothiol-dependent enzyme [Gordonia hongkongensis]
MDGMGPSMRLSRHEVWTAVHDERRRLADDLAEIPDEMWRAASLCPGWDVADVVAHIVDTAHMGRLAFVRDMLLARFDFDRANDLGVKRRRRPRPADLVADIRAAVDLTRTPPAPPATRLVEAIVHGEDVRRPLGLVGDYPVDAVLDALDYQLRTAVSWGGGAERAEGLRLIATDCDYVAGEGRDVEGTALDLLLTVSGRGIA